MDENTVLEMAKPFVTPNHDESTVNALKVIFSKINFDDQIFFRGKISHHAEESWHSAKKGDYVNNLILMIADSLGMANIIEHQKIFERFQKNTIQLDTCFPTTTSTVMTSLSHLSFPSEHGIIGYNFWHEKTDELVNTLNLKTIKDGKTVHVNDLGLNKSDFISGRSLVDLVIQKAENEGKTLNLKLFKPRSLERDGIIQFLFPLHYVLDYPDLDPSYALRTILTDLQESRFDLQLFVFYYPHADHASHYFGSRSPEYLQSLHLLQKILLTLTRHSSVKSGETAVILTSDHGQVDLPKEGSESRVTIDENAMKELRKRGLILGTTGRTLQVYFTDEDKSERQFDEFLLKLSSIKNHLQVLDKKDVMSLFGPSPPSESIEKRIGDKIILMEEHVFIDCPPIVPYGSGLPLKADHGSLTPREVKVPFMIF